MIASIKGKLGDAPLVEASIRRTMGAAYMELGRYEEAEEHFKRARDIRLEELGESDEKTIESISNLGTLYVGMSRLAEAEPLLKTVLRFRTARLTDRDPTTLSTKGMLGVLYMSMKRWGGS